MDSSKLHVAMFSWLAYGHMIPFLHLANELAKRGHIVSFLLPGKAQTRLQTMNLYPNLIQFYALSVPHVHGLPHGAETTSDLSNTEAMVGLLATAMDELYGEIKALLTRLKPQFVFYDAAHWIPAMAHDIGIKSIAYTIVSPASLTTVLLPPRREAGATAAEMVAPPPGYPSSLVLLRESEVRLLKLIFAPFGKGIIFKERLTNAVKQCDAMAVRTCKEIDGAFCDYLASQFGRPVLYTGPVLPETSEEALEDKIGNWLDSFEAGSVVFCALGSEWYLEKQQFQQLVLGFEQTGLPFLLALKPPRGTTSVEEGLPEGFQERVQNRGMVCGGWMPQTVILGHTSVGCFVSHCGYGSMWESLLSDCQLVLVPNLFDQVLNTRQMVEELGVAVEVERDENGWFTKEQLCKAVKSVMDKDSQIGCLVRENHKKWKHKLSMPGFMMEYVDNFIRDLRGLLDPS